MAINRSGYIGAILAKTHNATINKDFTLDETETSVVAWNSALGDKPTQEFIEAQILQQYKKDLIARINLLAGHIRASYLSDGEYVVEEYRLAETEALDFKSRGYVLPIPATVRDYAEILGTTNHQAVADGILTTAAQLKGLLTAVRKIRLSCTEGVRASTTIEAADTVFRTSEALMKTLRNPSV